MPPIDQPGITLATMHLKEGKIKLTAMGKTFKKCS
jgi:hypothetical protein